MIHTTEPEAVGPYLRDASNLAGGYADEVFVPQSVQELRECVRGLALARRPFTVAGRGTGLAGGKVPFGGSLIVTDRLDAIRSFDAERRTLTAEPGVLLREVQDTAAAHGLLYPPDPTERLCSLGGSVATNASGARTFRYGPTRRYVQALDVLLPDGEELQLRRGEVQADGNRLTLYALSGKRYDIPLPAIEMPQTKHAAGYYVAPGMDAIDLFIGSEGTLGVIAGVEVSLEPAPENIVSAMAWFASEERLLDFVEEARARSYATRRGGKDIDARALELYDRRSLDYIADLLPQLPADTVGAVWFEQETTDTTEESLLAAWYDLLGRHTSFADQTVVAMTEGDRAEMRAWRHAVSARVYERLAATGQTKIGTDMAVPDSCLRELYAMYSREFNATGLDYIMYGHIGNNHLHANLFVRTDEEQSRARAAYDRCMDRVLALGGTISAEHGVGKIKRDYLRRLYGEKAIQEFRAMKRIVDPALLLGRNTMFCADDFS